MIISLRGTNGAGKSTLVRKIMKLYDEQYQVYENGRKKPLQTLLRRIENRSLVVPGHYEIANGGVDTLPSLDKAYELVNIAHANGADVLYEGKNMSDGTERVIEMHVRGLPVHVVAIKIDTDAAIAAVRKRGHGIKAETVAKLNVKVQKQIDTFGKAGVPVWYLSRASALKKIRNLLTI